MILPRIGPFYFYDNSIIIPSEYQRMVNSETLLAISEHFTGSPLEHRDMWDNYMVIQYPELKITFDDDHKALPRGRVDFEIKNNQLSFFITLDRCIVGYENEIKWLYNLTDVYSVGFFYGTMNYKCINCR